MSYSMLFVDVSGMEYCGYDFWYTTRLRVTWFVSFMSAFMYVDMKRPMTVTFMIKLYRIIYMVYYIDRLSYVEPSLHLWDKAYLVMVDNIFDVFLESVCQYFIEYLRIYVHEGDCRKMGPIFISILLTCIFLLVVPCLVGKIFFNDFVEYVFCAFELVFFTFFYPYYLKFRPFHSAPDFVDILCSDLFGLGVFLDC
ncbi:hypothetical protein STEG23_008145 [Scotinomys teguina]